MTVDNYPIENPAGEVDSDAFHRIATFLNAKIAKGEVNSQFDRDMVMVMVQMTQALGTLKTIAQGHYTSCAHESQYASGVVVDSHRIFTPQEAAQMFMDKLTGK